MILVLFLLLSLFYFKILYTNINTFWIVTICLVVFYLREVRITFLCQCIYLNYLGDFILYYVAVFIILGLQYSAEEVWGLLLLLAHWDIGSVEDLSMFGSFVEGVSLVPYNTQSILSGTYDTWGIMWYWGLSRASLMSSSCLNLYLSDI